MAISLSNVGAAREIIILIAIFIGSKGTDSSVYYVFVISISTRNMHYYRTLSGHYPSLLTERAATFLTVKPMEVRRRVNKYGIQTAEQSLQQYGGLDSDP